MTSPGGPATQHRLLHQASSRGVNKSTKPQGLLSSCYMLGPGQPLSLSPGNSCLVEETRPANIKQSWAGLHRTVWIVDASRDAGRAWSNSRTSQKGKTGAPMAGCVDPKSNGLTQHTKATGGLRQPAPGWNPAAPIQLLSVQLGGQSPAPAGILPEALHLCLMFCKPGSTAQLCAEVAQGCDLQMSGR